MLNLDISNRHTTLPQLGTTLWHCGQCNAFISIHSAQLLDAALCPGCGKVRLEFCGRLTSIPGIQFGDA
jgi:uncharacterized paraquat-inducible protein A